MKKTTSFNNYIRPVKKTKEPFQDLANAKMVTE